MPNRPVHSPTDDQTVQVVADLADLNVPSAEATVADASNPSVQDSTIEKLQAELAETQAQIQALAEREKRVLADYQNLIRRSQEERIKVAKLAGAEFVSVLLQPLDHLSRAAAQLKDKGLDMVVNQFWQVLGEVGLKEISVLGQKFDVTTMEAIERKGEGEKVVAVASKGYTLNGEVIQHAKVVLG